jgi:hypothetical protein
MVGMTPEQDVGVLLRESDPTGWTTKGKPGTIVQKNEWMEGNGVQRVGRWIGGRDAGFKLEWDCSCTPNSALIILLARRPVEILSHSHGNLIRFCNSAAGGPGDFGDGFECICI